MTVAVIRGDALQLPLRDESVDLIVTSPPFYALRDYGTPGQLGSEPTPAEFLEALWAATREMARVLKPSGSIWVNLGDKYAGNAKGTPWTDRTLPWNGQTDDGRVADYSYGARNAGKERPRYETSIRDKSLIGLPWRYAIGCIDQLGLILRAELIWSKPNGLPESVTDRVRRSHEQWFHFTRSPRYYAALDEIRTPHARPWTPGRNGGKARAVLGGTMAGLSDADAHPLGALPGSVWSIPSEPLRLPPWIDTDHYAAFNVEFPRRFILAFSPPGLCVQCGQGRFPVVERRQDPTYQHAPRPDKASRFDLARMNGGGGMDETGASVYRTEATILGYACGCCPHTDHPERRGKGWNRDRNAHAISASGRAHDTDMAERAAAGPVREYHLFGWSPPPTRPAIILDPFSGTGTVAHVAHALGRIGVGVDLSEAYCRLATDQTLARQRATKVLGRVWAERQLTLGWVAE